MTALVVIGADLLGAPGARNCPTNL
jgi:hypothetical protein